MKQNIYSLAGNSFNIITNYNFFHRKCCDYVTTKNPQLSILISVQDIQFMDMIYRSNNEYNPNMERTLTPNYFEFLAVQRKVTEALLDYDTILFHASALAMDGKGYLFTALSGTGKSTHSRLWREQFGDRVTMINDDKPFIHIGEDEARVYGSPWDGKHHLSTNTSVPIKAIVILTRDTTNHIERINADEAFPILYQQTQRFKEPEKLIKIMDLLKLLTDRVELYRLGCNMDPEAAIVSYEGMNHE